MKANPRLLAYTFIILVSLDARLLVAEPVTLKTAVSSGLTNSPAAREALSQVRRASAERDVAFSALLPSLNLEGSMGAAYRERLIDGSSLGTGRNLFSQSINAVMEQLLFDWGASKRLVESAALRETMANNMVLDAQNRIGLAITETYAGILKTREQIAELKRLEANLAELKEKAASSAGKAAGSKQQTVLIESRLVDAKTQRIQATGNLRALEGRFRILTALEPSSLAGLPSLRLPSLDEARRSSPLLRANEAALEASKVTVEAAQRGRLPKFYADVAYGVGQGVSGVSGPDNHYSALAVGRWTPISGGKNLALVDQARSDVDRDTAALESSLELLADSLELAKATRSAEQQRLAAMAGLAKELELSFRDVDDSARTGSASQDGKTSWLTVAQTQSDLARARLVVIEARYGQDLATYRALSSAGSLCSALGIEGIVHSETEGSAQSLQSDSEIESAARQTTQSSSIGTQKSSGLASLIQDAQAKADASQAAPAVPAVDESTGSEPATGTRKGLFGFKREGASAQSPDTVGSDTEAMVDSAPAPVPTAPPVATSVKTPASGEAARVEALPATESKDRLPLGQRDYLFQKTPEQAAADTAAAQDTSPTERVPLAERRFLFDRERKVSPPAEETRIGS